VAPGIDAPLTEPVITRYRSSAVNLRTELDRAIKRAGLEPWPKRFQNLRSTRETELTDQGFPQHVVCAWLGNSPKVAHKHYLQVTPAHFAAALSGECTNAVHAPVSLSTRSSQRGASSRGNVENSASSRKSRRLPMPPAGIEPATRGLGNRCSIP
jgi:hypothetical protein